MLDELEHGFTAKLCAPGTGTLFSHHASILRSRRQLELARAQRRKVLLDRGVAHLLERGGRPARRLGKSYG